MKIERSRYFGYHLQERFLFAMHVAWMGGEVKNRTTERNNNFLLFVTRVLVMNQRVQPTDSPATGVISLTGTVQEGATLTITEDTALADADGAITKAYQWLKVLPTTQPVQPN